MSHDFKALPRVTKKLYIKQKPDWTASSENFRYMCAPVYNVPQRIFGFNISGASIFLVHYYFMLL